MDDFEYAKDKVLMGSERRSMFISEKEKKNTAYHEAGHGNDIERATGIAHKMVCEWGMSKTLGPVAFGKKEESIFLGREITRSHSYSEKTAELIDSEVRRLVDESYKKARELLEMHRDQLESLAETLLKHETLDAEQIQAVLDGKPLPDPKPIAPSADANVWEPTADESEEAEGADAPILGPAGYSGSTS
jgi:cell division protease FtsH